MAVCKLRREPSPDASPAGILNLHCQSSELRKTKCPLFEPHALRYLVTAAEQTKVPAFPHLTLPVSVFHVLGHATLFHPGQCGHLTLSNAQPSPCPGSVSRPCRLGRVVLADNARFEAPRSVRVSNWNLTTASLWASRARTVFYSVQQMDEC